MAQSLAKLMDAIAAHLAEIRNQITAAARRADRDASSVQLVAVSKTHPAEAVQAAADAGQRVFGESRVQEAREKIPACPPRLDWHFIGHLQKNKVRQALPLFSFFHSIDSPALAEAINRIAGEMEKPVEGLLEVNVSGEETKHGFTPDELRTAFPALAELPHLRIRGLMTMAPYSDNPEDARPVREVVEAMISAWGAGRWVALLVVACGRCGAWLPLA